jgi:cytochrome c-type biogenesis protein CcmH/NrfF
MNSGFALLAVYEPLPLWLNFLAIAVPLLLTAIGTLVWMVKFRKRRKRKYRQRHHEERKLNPTLAESGGLPPVREEKKSAANFPPP